MIRRIVLIDQQKCIGCGKCVNACHEKAIVMENGKAKLLRDDFCDGFGDCLPACPADAISFIEREALAYDEVAVATNKIELMNMELAQKDSQFINWPIQIKLAPVVSESYNNKNLLISADCSIYVYKNYHEEFFKGNIVLVGCPKLDGVDYSVKLTEILFNNNVKSIILTKMSVPCCNGMKLAIEKAIKNSGKTIPFKIVTFNNKGEVID